MELNVGDTVEIRGWNEMVSDGTMKLYNNSYHWIGHVGSIDFNKEKKEMCGEIVTISEISKIFCRIYAYGCSGKKWSFPQCCIKETKLIQINSELFDSLLGV